MSEMDVLMAVEIAGLLLAIAVLVRRSATPPTNGAWVHVSWQQAHAAVRLVTRRRSVYALVCLVVGLPLYITNFKLSAISLSGLAFEAFLATAASRWALHRIERPAVQLGRRGGWLWVHGMWVCCGESALEHAAALPAAQQK